MVSTFFFALLTNRAYFAYWSPNNPFPLQRLFEQPYIDWRYDPLTADAVFKNKSLHTTHRRFSTQAIKTTDATDEILFKDGPETNWTMMLNETVGVFIWV